MKLTIKLSIWLSTCIGAHAIITASQQPPEFDTLRECAFQAMRANGYMSLKAIAPQVYDHIMELAEYNVLKKHGKNVTTLTYTPDSSQLISGDLCGNVYVWQPQTGTRVNTFKDNAGFMRSLSIRLDGTQLASGSGHPIGGDNTLRIWDKTTGKIVKRIPHAAYVSTTAYSPLGDQLASGSGHQVRLYNSRTFELIKVLATDDEITKVTYSPQRDQLAVGCHQSIRFYDSKTGDLLRIIDNLPYIWDLAYNHTGTRLAAGISGKIVHIYNTQTGDLVRTLDTGYRAEPGEYSATLSLAYSLSDKQLAAAYTDGMVRLWNPTTGELERVLDGHVSGWAKCLAYSPDETQLACADSDGHIRLWNLNLEPLKCACHSLNLKEIMLIEEICRKGTQGIQTDLSTSSEQARLFAVLPKPIRTIIARYVTCSTSKCAIQ
jgi:WD40 repeat protein